MIPDPDSDHTKSGIITPLVPFRRLHHREEHRLPVERREREQTARRHQLPVLLQVNERQVLFLERPGLSEPRGSRGMLVQVRPGGGQPESCQWDIFWGNRLRR